MPRVYTQGIKYLRQKLFFHPDFTVGIGITPILRQSARGLSDNMPTAGREFHPALKMYSIAFSIAPQRCLVKLCFLCYDYSVTPVGSVSGVAGVEGSAA